MTGVVFQATPTTAKFLTDPSYIRLIAGPIGSGKSALCSHELVRIAHAQAPNREGVRKSRALVVRNTAGQLRDTTQKTFFEWFPHGVWGTFKSSVNTFYMERLLPDKTKIQAEVCFTPLDTPDDVQRALSLELTTLWINEWRELHPEVVEGLLMRLRRYPRMADGGPTRSCAIFDTNMPDLDTWHFNMMESPPEGWSVLVQPPAILSLEEFQAQEGIEPDSEKVIRDARGVSWWVNPRADNLQHLHPEYYPGNIPGKSEDFINVYLRCRYGRSLAGVPVFDKTFNPDFHLAKTPFTPLKSPDYPLIIGQDFGRTPCSVLMQRNAKGQMVVLDEVVSENMGIETYVNEKLAPKLARSEYLGCHVVVAPDPAGFAKQQLGEVSPADIIRSAGYRVVKPVTNAPERRIEAVERLLLRHVDGNPALVINPQCTNLIRAMRYAYKYKLNRSGVQNEQVDKNHPYSDVADALQYGVLVSETGAVGVQVKRTRQIVSAHVSARAWT